MVRRSPLRLVLVGLPMAAAPAIAAFVPYLWVPVIVSALAGLYLIAWATLGMGYWCRECKRFSVLAGRRAAARPRAPVDPGDDGFRNVEDPAGGRGR